MQAIIHAHPIFATALTVAGRDLPADVLPGVALTPGSVPVTGNPLHRHVQMRK